MGRRTMANNVDPQVDLVRISFLLSRQERGQMKVKAAEAGVSMSEILRQAVREFCKD